jgi:prepilin-type N-terminal cleavage/methylation domain-containing protein
MRHSSQTTRSPGFTLVELIISLGLVVIVSGAALLVFWSGIVLWQRHEAESTTHLNSTQAVRLITADARQAVRCKQWGRSGLSDALELVLPADTDARGNFIPVWEKKKLQYREGQRLIFYLSDETGAYDAGGDILWRGTIQDNKDPKASNVAPDTDWSLYYDTGRGRVSGIESTTFEAKDGEHRVAVTLTAAAEQGDRMCRSQASGLAYLRNHN